MENPDFDIVLWVRMIKEGIKKKNLNPWDVNIAEIADYYIQKIKEFKKFDIRLSADVILVAGILLRMKSEALYDECKVEDDDYEYYENNYEECVVINEASKNKKNKKNNKKNKKPVSVDELIKTIEKELNRVKKSKKKRKNKKITEVEEIVEELIEDEDISDIMDELIDNLLKEGVIIYQEKFKNRDERVKYFLPSLYLANDGKVELIQRKLFGDLIIKYKNPY